MTQPCPCGSGVQARACCAPFIDGETPASPEQLMRARYCAYRGRHRAFLLDSWHPSTRPTDLAFEHGLVWRRLEVVQSDAGSSRGNVKFIATWQKNDHWGQLQENARFTHENGRWYYVDGDVIQIPVSPGRNAPCPCGSGLKYKRCCAP